MSLISHLRVLRLTDYLIGFYDGRVPGQRFAEGSNWVDDGALSLGICSYAVIDGADALVYDTHVSLAHAQAIRTTVEKLGARRIRVALSHGHLDHIAGNAVFGDCEIIAHRLTAEALTAQKEAIEQGRLNGPPSISPLTLPTTQFDDMMPLRVGGIEVQLRHLDIHSRDGVVAYFPDDGDLLAGDTLEDTITYVAEPDRLGDHLKDLDRLWGWEIERIFPNHGDPAMIENGGYRKTLVRATQQYVRTLMRAAREPDLAALPLAEFIAGPLQAGWVNYFAPYEAVHRRNLAKVA